LTHLLRERPEPYLGSLSDRSIDYSDIPAMTDAQLKRAKRVRPGRPPIGLLAKKMISLKLDPILLEQLKGRARREGKGYQVLIQEILERAIRSQK
jgi:uncharacterized protein (DUF4415 family)